MLTVISTRAVTKAGRGGDGYGVVLEEGVSGEGGGNGGGCEVEGGKTWKGTREGGRIDGSVAIDDGVDDDDSDDDDGDNDDDDNDDGDAGIVEG